MILMPDLYGADAERLLHRLREAEAEDQAILLIGHNPALQQLTLSLSGSGDAAMLASVQRKFSTASLAVIRFDVRGWDGITPARGELECFVRAKQLQR